MTKTDQFAHQAETELRGSRMISADTIKLWESLDPQQHAALAGAMAFIGANVRTNGELAVASTAREDRFAASRLMLLKLRVDTDDPRWSSETLSRYVRGVLAIPMGTLDDVLLPLSELVGESEIELSAPLANFLKDVVILCFTEYGEMYSRSDWDAFVRSLEPRPTQAQCYLALHALPPEKSAPHWRKQ